MTKKNRIFDVLTVIIFALCGAVFLFSKALADDTNELLQKQNEVKFEDQKKTDENIFELQKKSLENAREAQKKEMEQLRETQKKTIELNKEGSSSKDNENDEDNGTTSVSEKNGKNENDGDLHRSAVANFVQSLHALASSSPRGIGDRVREVAKSQNDDKDKTADDINTVKSRGGFMKFFIGVDQDSIQNLETSVSVLQDNIDKLNQIKASSSPEIQKSLNKAIRTLSKEKERVDNVINDNKGVVGIFGWFMNFFR